MKNKALLIANKSFGKKNFRIINPGFAYCKQFKIVTFIPAEKSDEVAFRMASAGAGVIGSYTVCSFRTKGVGTFKGSKSSKPAIGSPGKYEMVEEVKLEMICKPEFINNAIDEMIKVHPYEEPAYDVYPVIIRNKKPVEHTAAIKLNKKVLYGYIINKLRHNVNIENLPNAFTGMYTDTLLINAGKTEINPEVFADLTKPFLYISIKNKKIKFDIIEQR
jgi:hypothetical protein